MIHFVMLIYSKQVAEFIGQSYDLQNLTDYQFLKTVLAVLKNLFSYDPKMRVEDFFAVGIPETKMLFLQTIIALVKAKD